MKKQADEKKEKIIKAFVRDFSRGINELSNILTVIEKKSTRPASDVGKFMNTLNSLWAVSTSFGRATNIDPTRLDVKNAIEKYDTLKKRAMTMKEKFAEIEKSQEKMREREPEETVGPISVRELSKSDIEDKLFELNEKKKSAISKKEKDQIQKKIDELVKIYGEGD